MGRWKTEGLGKPVKVTVWPRMWLEIRLGWVGSNRRGDLGRLGYFFSISQLSMYCHMSGLGCKISGGIHSRVVLALVLHMCYLM